MRSVLFIFDKYAIDSINLTPLYEEFRHFMCDAKIAFAYEKNIEELRKKNEADLYRDKLHSKLFNYLKSILYDENDSRFDDAQIVMRVLKGVGNPTRLTEKEKSVMLNTLGNQLGGCVTQLYAIGAKQIVESLMEANQQFIDLEKKFRKTNDDKNLSKMPLMGAVRKQVNKVYRIIVDAINGYAEVMYLKYDYHEMTNEMNKLSAKYDMLQLIKKKT